MDEMSMTLDGINFPIHALNMEFKDKSRSLLLDGFAKLRKLEEQKPKDAVDFIADGWDAKDLVPGNWVRGLFIDYSSAPCRYEIGCGVICARPSTLKPPKDGERSRVVHFLPEGCTGWKAMELRHVWTYGPDRPKFDEVNPWFKPGYAAEIAFSFKDEARSFYARYPMQNPVIQSAPIVANVEPDDNIVAAEPPAWYNPMRENAYVELTAEVSVTESMHWHCEDCGEDNDFDQHPRRCGTCRRYKP